MLKDKVGVVLSHATGLGISWQGSRQRWVDFCSSSLSQTEVILETI